MPLTIFFEILAIAITAVAISKGTTGWYVGAVICYLIYICEIACSRTMSFLNNIEAYNDIVTHIKEIKTKPPVVTFDIQNFHNEWRTEMRHGRIHTDYV
jgi:hypothetical protein